MVLVLALFGVLALVTPAISAKLGPKVFPILALLPTGVFAWTLAQAPVVLGGGELTESYRWLPEFGIVLGFRMDMLAWVLALVVTGVGALVLLYCTWYFTPKEPNLGRFAAFLLLFAGVMWGLVTSDDVIVMFVFWEITSVLSYLLIGHYTDKRASRGAALQALLVTTLGGLAMLVGIVMLSSFAGTTSLAGIVEATPPGVATSVAVALVLAGAVSKSALVPFHFWLPAAMAAPTPVSAYLHAAAMVKAGVYLVARLAPGFAEDAAWTPIVIGLGLLTMLMGAYRSLRQHDLKLILAHGTVSQLGFLMVVVGFGTPDTAVAGLALLVAHALYKATLFLVVGIVDHNTGTRDIRELSGVGRRQPVLVVIAVLAAASMAGLPPLFGFVAKEAVFSTFIEAGTAWGWVALVGTAVGSVLTVGYTARFIWGAFRTRPDAEPTPIHDGSPLFLGAPALLALAGLGTGIASSALDPVFAVHGAAIGEVHYHLALWHGLEPALFISIGVLALGGLLFVAKKKVAKLQAAAHELPGRPDAARAYWATTRSIDQGSAWIAKLGQRAGLPGYLGTILVCVIVLIGGALLFTRSWPEGVVLWDHPAQVVIALLMGVAAVSAARAKHRMTAVLLAGVTGYGMVALFAMHGSPDIALTQALVETLTLVVFVLVFRRLPKKIAQRNKPSHRTVRLVIASLVGIVMAIVGVVALGARSDDPVSLAMPELAYEEGHGRNVVNVLLVDIRAWDTMLEISVLVVVATGIASLLFLDSRAGSAPRLAGIRERRSWSSRRKVGAEPSRGDGGTQQTWLVAGRTLSAENRSIMVEVVVRLLFHPAILVSIYLLLAGHNDPGGGFAGGLLAGLALVARYLAGGRYELGEALPVDAGKVLGVGLILAVGTALVPLVFGQEALESTYWAAELPVLGYVSFTTSMIFDVGVYLVVIGLVLDVLRSLGGEVDRHAEIAAERDRETRPTGLETDTENLPTEEGAR